MNKYYIIPFNTLDPSENIKGIKENQEVEDVTTLVEGDLTQVWKIAHMQNYEGLAVVTTSNVLLKEKFIPEDYITDNMITFSQDKNVFIINCSHPWFKTKINVFSNLSKYMKFDIGGVHKMKENKNLRNHFLPEVIDEKVDDKKSGLEFSGDSWKMIEDMTVEELDEQTRKEIILGDEDFSE